MLKPINIQLPSTEIQNLNKLKNKIKHNREMITETQKIISLNLNKEESKKFDWRFIELYDESKIFSSDIMDNYSMNFLNSLFDAGIFDTDLIYICVDLVGLYEDKSEERKTEKSDWLQHLETLNQIELTDDNFDAANVLFAHIFVNASSMPLTARFRASFAFGYAPTLDWKKQAEIFLDCIEHNQNKS